MNIVRLACRFSMFPIASNIERAFDVTEEERARIETIERTAGTVNSLTAILVPGWRSLRTVTGGPSGILYLRDALALPRREQPGTIAANTRLCFCLMCSRELENDDSAFAAYWRLMRGVMDANGINWLAPSAEAQAVKLLNAVSSEVSHGDEEAKSEG